MSQYRTSLGDWISNADWDSPTFCCFITYIILADPSWIHRASDLFFCFRIFHLLRPCERRRSVKSYVSNPSCEKVKILVWLWQNFSFSEWHEMVNKSLKEVNNYLVFCKWDYLEMFWVVREFTDCQCICIWKTIMCFKNMIFIYSCTVQYHSHMPHVPI